MSDEQLILGLLSLLVIFSLGTWVGTWAYWIWWCWTPITITGDRFYPTGPYDNPELNLRLKKAKQYLLTRSSK